MTDQTPDSTPDSTGDTTGDQDANDLTALSDGNLPEEARQAILRLIEEIDTLRRELQANNDRIAGTSRRCRSADPAG